MADPRNAVDFEGIDGVYETFKIDNSTITYDATKANGAATTMIGKAVTFSADSTVALAADGDHVVGKLMLVESDNKANVQTEGGMTLPGGTGATLTRGTPIVGALLSSAKGYIRSAASGTAADLLVAVGEIRDASDTTAVKVTL